MTSEELKQWRADLRLGETGMANYLGVPIGTYRKWESGHRGLGAAQLRLIDLLKRIQTHDEVFHDELIAEARNSETKPGKPGRKKKAEAAAPVVAADALPSWLGG